MGNWFRNIFIMVLSLPVHFYRLAISPLLPPSCRHVPSCSQYALDAFRIHGPFTGLLMATGRILRCRPGGTHGYDPVPLIRFKKYKTWRFYGHCNRLR
jgi:putative membrane protein insertion efficiency factor